MYENWSFNTNFPQIDDYRDGTCNFQRYRFIYKQEWKKKLLRSTSSITLHLSKHQLYKHTAASIAVLLSGGENFIDVISDSFIFSRAVFCATKLGCRTADGKKRGEVLFFFVRTLLRMDGSGCLGVVGGGSCCCVVSRLCFVFFFYCRFMAN